MANILTTFDLNLSNVSVKIFDRDLILCSACSDCWLYGCYIFILMSNLLNK